MDATVRQRFFTNTDHTGRFMVYSARTGRQYFVEPIGTVKTGWGSVDPATGQMMHKKGDGKYKGSIEAKESLITEENGFKNIRELGVGVSPHNAIDVIDAQYPDKVTG
jgi:hypothetical protein